MPDALHIIMGAVEALGLVLTAVINLLSPDQLVFTRWAFLRSASCM